MDNEFLNIDCMEYMKSLNNNSIDLVLTDIPYDGVNDNDDSGGLRKLNKSKADIITFDLENFLNEISINFFFKKNRRDYSYLLIMFTIESKLS